MRREVRNREAGFGQSHGSLEAVIAVAEKKQATGDRVRATPPAALFVIWKSQLAGYFSDMLKTVPSLSVPPEKVTP
jgi:hypothetical protein